MISSYIDAMKMADRAHTKAMNRIRTMVGISLDPEVRVYKNLKPYHFDRMVEQYGEEAVRDYRNRMEARSGGNYAS